MSVPRDELLAGPSLKVFSLCSQTIQQLMSPINCLLPPPQPALPLSQPPWLISLSCMFENYVQCRGVRFNCRVFLLNRKILFIRPKLSMADDGNYRQVLSLSPALHPPPPPLPLQAPDKSTSSHNACRMLLSSSVLINLLLNMHSQDWNHRPSTST